MSKKVLIIGNGFDLNLGWKTSYKHYMQSDYWPVKRDSPGCPMEEYFATRLDIDRWFDLESALKTYATKTRVSYHRADPKDEAFFNELRYTLACYLGQEEKKDVDNDSLAIQVLKAVINNGYFSSIYTFNYTNLYSIAEKAGISSRFDFSFVHGCVARNSIIVGVDDHTELREGYGYLRKVFSEHYTSHPIRYDLQESDEVIFFGHSLGENDYPYFSDFFMAQCHCATRKDSKHITIFTKDNNSRIQILEQLRIMNGGQTEHLQNDNDFKIIMTDNPNKEQLNEFFKHLTDNSIKKHYETLDKLASII